MRRLAGAIAAAALVAAPGCGGKAAQPFSLSSIVDRAEKESSRGTMVMKLNQPGEGRFGFEGTFIISADGTQGLMRGDAEYNDERFRMTVRQRADDVWVTGPAIARNLPRGKRWIHGKEQTGSFRTMSPSEFVGFLRDAGDVERVGAEQVAGKPATHYRGDVSFEALVKAQKGEAADYFRGRRLPSGSLPIDVWVSEDDLPVRIRIDFRDEESSFFIDATMEEYGVEVDVQPPPADTVIEESELG